jgi:hypothetical protein
VHYGSRCFFVSLVNRYFTFYSYSLMYYNIIQDNHGSEHYWSLPLSLYIYIYIYIYMHILNQKHVDVLSHSDLSCHGTWRPHHDCYNPSGVLCIHVYIFILYLELSYNPQNSIKTPLYPRGLNHLNSDKPFWTRRYYAVQENPGSIAAVPPTLIIYPGPCRPR